MAAGNFEACLKFVLQFEGGFVNNPKDPGGPTNLGVTQATLSGFLGRQATIDEVKARLRLKKSRLFTASDSGIVCTETNFPSE